MIAERPIGPAPTIGDDVARRDVAVEHADLVAVGRMSATIRTSSSVTPAGTGYVDVSANGTRTYSACVPSIRWPRIQPPPPRHWP